VTSLLLLTSYAVDVVLAAAGVLAIAEGSASSPTGVLHACH
jgi:hypothetical protein